MLVVQKQMAVDVETFPRHGEIVERQIAILALAEVESHGRLLPRRLSPSDCCQEEIRVCKIRLHEELRRPVSLHCDGERDGKIASDDVIDVQPESLRGPFR